MRDTRNQRIARRTACTPSHRGSESAYPECQPECSHRDWQPRAWIEPWPCGPLTLKDRELASKYYHITHVSVSPRITH
jgi:hypothetical protein